MAAKTELTGPGKGIERDRYGRPIIKYVEAHGGQGPYTRCTTFVSALEDTYNLTSWKQRMTLLGAAHRSDVIAGASTVPIPEPGQKLPKEQNKILDELAEKAMEAAHASSSATIGTAIHSWCEKYDRGDDVTGAPETIRKDIEAYAEATQKLRHVQIETFGVFDGLKVAGTWDRIVEIDGKQYIADIKTGRIDYGIHKIAMQLAMYAHCQKYDAETGRRSSIGPVSTEWALIIHLPAGTATCNLVWVDIAKGWEGVQLAYKVREWRRHTPQTRAFTASTTEAMHTGLAENAATALTAAIQNATTADELTRLWTEHQATWTEAHTSEAKSRKQSFAA